MRPIARKHLALFTIGALALAATAGEAAAQRSSGVTSRTSGGTSRQGMQSGMGSGGQQLSGSQGGRTGGQSSFGQGRTGAGGTGMGGAGGGAPGQGGAGQGPMSAGLAQSTSERFQEGGFVGRDAQDVRNSFDSLSGGRGQGQMMDQMIENLNEMRESRRRWREQNAAPPAIRVRLVPSFDLPMAPIAGTISPEVQARLTKIMSVRGVGAPQVQVAGGVAILRGQVATEHERALLARIAALEPGVSRVENLVTIPTLPLVPPQ